MGLVVGGAEAVADAVGEGTEEGLADADAEDAEEGVSWAEDDADADTDGSGEALRVLLSLLDCEFEGTPV